MSRQYHFVAMRPGGFMNWPGLTVNSPHRIRQTVVIVFRRWFGHDPIFHWGKDGFMAEAWDARGNHVSLEQVNQPGPAAA